MTPPQSPTLLQARRRRVRRIRRRVVGLATALFVVTTGGIFVQLVSGHDPALATTAVTTGSATTTTTPSSSTSGTSGSSTRATAVTTSQS